MAGVVDIVWAAIKGLALQRTKEKAQAARWSNTKLLITIYVFLAVVILLLSQGIATDILRIVAILGLSITWLISWVYYKKIYKVYQAQELHQLQNLVQLAQEKRNDGANILGTIRALAATVDAKDHYTHGHSEKVAKYATLIAQEIGYSRDKLESLRIAALLHDIGKIAVPDQLLNKPGSLSLKERKAMRSHPVVGFDIIKHVDAISECLPAVLHHHERYDGNGYPEGLKGSSIPLDARILAVADAYDAMTSERPYRSDKMTCEQALAQLARGSGTQFDPRIVETFVSLFEMPKLVATRAERSLAIAIDQANKYRTPASV